MKSRKILFLLFVWIPQFRACIEFCSKEREYSQTQINFLCYLKNLRTFFRDSLKSQFSLKSIWNRTSDFTPVFGNKILSTFGTSFLWNWNLQTPWNRANLLWMFYRRISFRKIVALIIF
jgi:hypothetical protein